MKFCPARRTLTIFTEPRLSGEDHGMKVLPIQPWGATPAPPVVPRKPPVSRKPEGPWPRARVTPMPPPSCKGVVNQGYQTNSPPFSPPVVQQPPPPTRRETPKWEQEETEEKRRKMEEDARREEQEERKRKEEEERRRRKEEEEDRKRRRVESEGEGAEVGGRNNGAGPPPCKCGKEAVEEEARLLKLHNVRLRQVASALASKLRASEATLGASRADADARLAALVRALLAFEAGLRREQSRIKFAMDRLEALVRAQKAEISVLKAAGAASGLDLEDVTSMRCSIAEADVLVVSGEAGSWSRGIRPASILRDVLRSQLGASWSKKEEGTKKALERSPALGAGHLRAQGEGEEKPLGEEVEKMSVEVVALAGNGGVAAEGGTRGSGGAAAGDGSRRPGEGGGDRADRVKPPLPPRPRPRVTTSSSEEGTVSCREQAPEKKSNRDAGARVGGAEDRGFRGHWAAVESRDKNTEAGDGGGSGSGMWGLNVHFEEFVLGEESSSDVLSSGGHAEYNDGDQPPSTPPPPPPPSTPPPLEMPTHPQTSSPPIPTVKPRTALLKPPRKNPPPNKHQATTVSPPPMRFLLPDLLCPTPRGQEGTGGVERNGLDTNAYLKENAMNGDRHVTNSHGINGMAKGRPLGPSALQNAISPKGKHEAVLEAAKGHCSYERFLEMTGLSQKSILTYHRPIPPPPASTARPLPPPPPKHRSVLKPRDVKMRSKAARSVGWEDGFVAGDGLVGVVAKEAVVGPTRRYWSGPYL